MGKRGRLKGSGTYAIFDGVIPTLRTGGSTLQEIGDKCGVSRERIRQILNEYYPDNVQRPERLATRNTIASLVGHSSGVLKRMEAKGILTPIHRGTLYLYPKENIGKIRVLVETWLQAEHKPLIELTCEVCGVKFYRKSYLIRRNSPGRFCSHKCLGGFMGNNYGFKVHPENIEHHGRKRKWDYDEIYKLRDTTGWGAIKISRLLGIPYPTVYVILQKRRKSPWPHDVNKEVFKT